jgi:hypothetical protein
MGMIVGVDEDVSVGLVIVEAASEELEVLVRDEGEVPTRTRAVQGGDPAHPEEPVHRVHLEESR